MGQIIDGKAVSAKVKEEIRLETEKLKEQGIEIGLAVVIVGDIAFAVHYNITVAQSKRNSAFINVLDDSGYIRVFFSNSFNEIFLCRKYGGSCN